VTKTKSRPMTVAVFGGSSEVPEEVLELAHCVGSKISAAEFVILTGGRLDESAPPASVESIPQESVKDAALLGAAPAGHWIGVLKGSNCPGFQREGKGSVIFSHMDHQRNFLEASLCDAAIVLEGGIGTISEAVSAISLGKPVLLAGTVWAKKCPALHQLFEVRNLADNSEDILFKKARKRLGEKTDKCSMRDLIEQALKPGSIQLHEPTGLCRRCAGMPGHRRLAHGDSGSATDG
jgi:predicted Rossmann-fold nucleotide-binding protein